MSVTLIDLNRWLSSIREDEHLEFKEAKQQFDTSRLIDYCVALANERGGKLICGVTNTPPRRIVGTAAFPDLAVPREKIFETLRLRIEIDEVQHPDGRVLIFHIPSRPIGVPLHHDGRYLMRMNDQLVAMTSDQLFRIGTESQPDYTAELVHGAALTDLEPTAVQEFCARWIHKSGNSSLINLSQQQLLADAGLFMDGELTLAALILFGTPQACSRYLPQAEIVFEYRSSEVSTSYQQRLEFRRGFFTFYDELWNMVNLRNDRQSYQDGLFRIEIPTFDETVVREAILNAVSHRDYRLNNSVFIRQSPRRLEIISPGGFPPGVTPENVLDRQVPRNRKVAEALQLCGLVERSGQGVNRMFEESIKQGKQVPDFSATDAYQVGVSLRGEVQHPAFVQFLEKLGRERLESFSTRDFLVLDSVHRGESIVEALKPSVARLVDFGAIERVGRKLILSRAMYAHMGQRGVYTRRRGLDHETQKALLLKHIRENATAGSPLSELVQVLPQVGYERVKRLLKELKMEDKIVTKGQRRWARWLPAPKSLGE